MIVESKLDVLLVNQEAGDLICVVALAGSHKNIDSDTLKFIETSPRLLLATDFDAPRNESDFGAGQTAFLGLRGQFPQAEYFPLATGKDPCEMHSGGIAVRDWILCALSSI